MIIENSLLKEKVFDLQERFRRVEEKRDAYIKDLSEKIKNLESQESRASAIHKNSSKLEK